MKRPSSFIALLVKEGQANLAKLAFSILSMCVFFLRLVMKKDCVGMIMAFCQSFICAAKKGVRGCTLLSQLKDSNRLQHNSRGPSQFTKQLASTLEKEVVHSGRSINGSIQEFNLLGQWSRLYNFGRNRFSHCCREVFNPTLPSFRVINVATSVVARKQVTMSFHPPLSFTLYKIFLSVMSFTWVVVSLTWAFQGRGD